MTSYALSEHSAAVTLIEQLAASILRYAVRCIAAIGAAQYRHFDTR